MRLALSIWLLIACAASAEVWTANLVADWQASNGVTLVSGRVSEWADAHQTLNNDGLGPHNLVQGTAGSRPYGMTDSNGLAAVMFPWGWSTDHPKTFLEIPATLTNLTSTGVTFYVVCTGPYAQTETEQSLISLHGVSGMVGFVRSNSLHPLSITSSDRSSTLYPPLNPAVLAVSCGPAATVFAWNHAQQSAGAISTATISGGDIGQSGSASEYWAGNVYRILIYDTPHSSSQVDSNISELILAYGITTNYTCNVVCRGDSLTEGVTQTSNQSYPWQIMQRRGRTKVYNLGVGGQRIGDGGMLSDDPYYVDPLYDSTVSSNHLFFLGGLNDKYALVEDEDIFQRTTNWVGARLEAHPEWKVFVATWPASAVVSVTNINQMLRADPRTNWWHKTIDLGPWSPIEDRLDDTESEYFATDHAHLSPTGAGVLAYWFGLEADLSRFWYVDSAATGGNSGLNWANAWTDMPSNTWAAKGISAGDTLYISGGSTSKTYTNRWSMDASGSAGSPITIRVGQDSGHTGMVLFDGTSHGDEFSGKWVELGNHITLDGSVSGVQKLMFNHIIHTNDRTTAQVLYRNEVCVGTVRFVIFTNVNNAIQCTYTTNSSIYKCDFYVLGDQAMTLGGSGTDWDQVLVYSNNITVWKDALSGGPDGIGCNAGISIFRNRFEAVESDRMTNMGQHTDFVQNLKVGYFKFYDNEVINSVDSCLDLECWDGTVGIENVRIYNNIFRKYLQFGGSGRFIRFYARADVPLHYKNIYIVNNLFLGNTNDNVSSLTTIATAEDANVQGTNNWIANNIWVNCSFQENNTMFSISKGAISNPSVWFITNNVYHPSPGYEGSVGYWDVFRTATYWIANYDPSGTTNAPTFVSYTNGGDSDDFRLQTGDTVALGKGRDFSALFTTDKNGNARGATWDIGPYQGSVDVTNSGPILRVGTMRVQNLIIRN